MVLSDKIRDKRHKLKHREFPLNIRKHLFTVRVMKQWNRLPREFVESPSLEIHKKHLNMILGNWLQVALFEQGVGLDDLQRSLPISTIL